VSGTHAILSPSKAAMILRCAAALAAGKGAPNPPSEYAAEGTAYHEISARALTALQDLDTQDAPDAFAGWACEHWVGQVVEADGFKFTIDEDNAAHAQKYVDAIRRLPGQQFYEVKLDISEVVGVAGQYGTADAITLDYDTSTIHVDDLKFGRGEIVDAHDNEQLLTYGAAALAKYDYLWEWHFVKVGIHQPRVNHYSDQVWAVDKLLEWVAASRPRFQRAYALYEDPAKVTAADYGPSEKGCRWCPIRGSCAARTKKVLDMFPLDDRGAPKTQLTPSKLMDFELGVARDRVEEVEQWCKDIKEEAHKRAIAGRAIPGWKLVQGRKGNRRWTDEALAETVLTLHLEHEAYTKKLISPSDAEKKLKKHVPTAWAEIQANISQAEGSLSLERESVSKPAVDRPMVEFPLAEPLA
jgi:hypothetical protein